MPYYFDIHSHLNFAAFDDDREQLIAQTLSQDTWLTNVGTQIDTSRKAVEIAEAYKEGVYAIVGLHPVHTVESFHDTKELGGSGKGFTSRGEAFDRGFYRQLCHSPKVIGIGECGLDYYHLDKESINVQKTAFEAELEFAREVDKPVMLHIRPHPKALATDPDPYSDALEILKNYPEVTGDVHFFAGTLRQAKRFIERGFTLSFTGVITFTHDYDEVVKYVPQDMIMAETDCPYVSPEPHRGKRNEPLNVQYVVKKMAEIRREDEEALKKAVVENALRVFNL